MLKEITYILVNMSNINVLVEAKNECTDKLNRVISPVAIEVMLTLYNDAYELTKGRQQLTQFQKLLQEVKSWNESIINDNTTKICEACSYFRDVLTAVFICYTKIMSSIRLGTVKKSINLKIPTNEIFVHTVLKDLADSLYNDPFFLQETKSNYEIKKEMCQRTKVAIGNAIQLLSPLDEILKTYVATTADEFTMEDEDEESEDPEIDSDMEEEEEEEAPVVEETPVVAEEPSTEEMEPELEDATSKIISFGDENKGEEEEEEEEESLFDDAPMEKK